MPFITVNDFKARLKTKGPEGWYIFTGEEDYLKNFYSRELTRAVCDDGALDAFNHSSWNAQEIDLGALAEAIQSPPMMQEYKLVEWRFANLDSLKEKELSILKDEIFTLKEDNPSAVFMIITTLDGFNIGTEKKPSKLARLFGSAFDIISFGKSTDTQLLSWLKKHFDSEGIEVSLPPLNAMLAKVGHSMEALNNEVIKLSAYLHMNGINTLTAEAVDLVCCSNIENDAFALKNAVNDGNARAALRVIAELKLRRTEPQAIIGMLSRIYSELSAIAMLSDEGESFDNIMKLTGISSYPLGLAIKAVKRLGTKKINSALRALLAADASSKNGGVGGYQAIELFIVQNI